MPFMDQSKEIKKFKVKKNYHCQMFRDLSNKFMYYCYENPQKLCSLTINCWYVQLWNFLLKHHSQNRILCGMFGMVCLVFFGMFCYAFISLVLMFCIIMALLVSLETILWHYVVPKQTLTFFKSVSKTQYSFQNLLLALFQSLVPIRSDSLFKQ